MRIARVAVAAVIVVAAFAGPPAASQPVEKIARVGILGAPPILNASRFGAASRC